MSNRKSTESSRNSWTRETAETAENYWNFNSFMTESRSHRNEPIDLHSKAMDWSLYDRNFVIKELNKDMYVICFKKEGGPSNQNDLQSLFF